MQYISRLTDKELQDIIVELKDAPISTQKKVDYLTLLSEAEYRKSRRKCVISKEELMKILNTLDRSDENNKLYILNMEVVLKHIFKFIPVEDKKITRKSATSKPGSGRK
jgi:hypothetical protein